MKCYKPDTWQQGAWFTIWFTLPLSIRWNSLVLIIAVLISLVSLFKNRPVVSKRQWMLFGIPVLFFLVMALGAFSERYWLSDWKALEKMLPLIIIPGLALIQSSGHKKIWEASMWGLILALLIGGMIMLTQSTIAFYHTGDPNVFYYHQLTKPFNTGAIYFSLFLVTALFQMGHLKLFKTKSLIKHLIVGFLVLLYLLAASKLFIVMGIPLLLWNYRKALLPTKSSQRFILLLLLIFGFLALIPFSQRMKQITQPHLDLVTAKKFKYDSPLNGLNLRLIQWRFGMEILQENQAWLTGVGINEAQNLLNQKYIISGIYTGYEGTDDTGYLNYNFHNQYVETLVRTGIVGLTLIISLFVMLFSARKTNHLVSVYVVFISAAFFFTESALERQQGIVYFCLIYSSIIFNNKPKSTHEL